MNKVGIRRTATGPSLAARFGVSERTVFRDLALLYAARPHPTVSLAMTNPSPELKAFLGDPPCLPGEGGRTELEIHWPVDAWLESWLCGQAPEVVVLEPAHLRAKVARRLQAAANAYGTSFQEP